jgi:hypothetical protein
VSRDNAGRIRVDRTGHRTHRGSGLVRSGRRGKRVPVCDADNPWHVSPRWEDVDCGTCLRLRGSGADPEVDGGEDRYTDHSPSLHDHEPDPETNAMRAAKRRRETT